MGNWRDGVPWGVALVAVFLLATCGQDRVVVPARDVPGDLTDVETVFVGFRSPVEAVGDAISELYGQGGTPVETTSSMAEGGDRVVVEVQSRGDDTAGSMPGTRCLVYEVDPVRQEAHLQDLSQGGCPGI